MFVTPNNRIVVSISSRKTTPSARIYASHRRWWLVLSLTLDTMHNALFPIHQRVQERSTQSYTLGAEAYCFDHVGPPSHPTIDVYLIRVSINGPRRGIMAERKYIHLALLQDFWAELVDLKQGVQCWRGSVQCSTTARCQLAILETCPGGD